jgi:hypothetical protein
MVPKFQVATACFSCSPPDLNSSKLRSLAVKITKIIYVNTNFEIKAPRPLSPATASYHSNAFTFTPTLTGRTSGRSLGTFSQSMLFLLPHSKVSHFPPGLSHVHLLFYYVSFYISLSLSLSLSRLGSRVPQFQVSS